VAARPRYEYAAVNTNASGTSLDLPGLPTQKHQGWLDVFDRLGTDGWRVATSWVNDRGVTIVFERPADNTPPGTHSDT
jgi:hypothetical protein